MDAREATGTADELKGKAEQTFGKLRDRMGDASEEFETFTAGAQGTATEAMERSMDWIRENPGSSLGIALLLGAGIGALLTAWAKD
jgi:ElaB/YqjD/DUF883 family membrane-anchored ribosome-binding protein